MCGIVGILNLASNSPVDRSILQSMNDALIHRGPDDQGLWIEDQVGLGMRRLSIIDLASGHQPMSYDQDRYWIVFNGEIYNFHQIRTELIKEKGHRFETQSDTEVILHLYSQYGPKCVDYLRGMFAFVIWDRVEKTAFIARDRFGKKPFYYSWVEGNLVFSSELQSLLRYPGISKEIDYASIDLYLSYQYIPSPHTIYTSVKKLPPAHVMTVKSSKSEIHCYWRPSFEPKTPLSLAEAKDVLMEKLRESVRLRMISDVPLGAFLSGGFDSSVVVALMSEQGTSPVKTFSIGFEEEEFSELPYARLVANRFGCDHHEFIVKPNMMDLIPKLVHHYGEPYADSSALPSFYLSQLTRQHVTVALSGDGGDEVFAGYPRHRMHRIRNRMNVIPSFIRQTILAGADVLSDAASPRSLSSRLHRYLSGGAADDQLQYQKAVEFFDSQQKQTLYSDDMLKKINLNQSADYLRQFFYENQDLHGLDPYLYLDLVTYLPECLMTKMDIVSMANSLEVRSPFLDHELVDLVGHFPDAWKINSQLHSKAILRETMKRQLPAPVLQRKKHGFSLPMGHWFREGGKGQYLKDVLLSTEARNRTIFKSVEVEKLIDHHVSGKADYSYQLWVLVMLENWFVEFHAKN